MLFRLDIHRFGLDLLATDLHAIHHATDELRDILTALRDTAGLKSITVASHRMNEVMKKLTAFASIILPLTFITGIFVMCVSMLGCDRCWRARG